MTHMLIEPADGSNFKRGEKVKVIEKYPNGTSLYENAEKLQQIMEDNRLLPLKQSV